MKLTIVIPAYNEEAAIASIIERTLAAREYIVAHSPVTDVNVVVVSDGSTDGTVSIASQYADIKLIAFERNRGYGAAIKRGFESSNSELVGFLDADGTCDPRFFADLSAGICNNEAAIALGSRMGPQSRMPRIRRLGNRIYAAILSLLTNRVVQDTASGMRVIRRGALDRLYPLPDGLHFTPAMSARAMLDDALPVVELPMAYEERVGESKLNVLRDGWRFLQTIMEMTLFIRPARVFLTGAVVCGLITLLFGLHPIEMWLTERRLEESMIYRLLFCSLLGSITIMCLSTLAITESLHAFSRDGRNRPRSLSQRALRGLFSAKGLIGTAVILLPTILALIGPGLATWLVERQVHIHWSRVVFAGLLTFTLCQMFVTKVILAVMRVHVRRNRFVETLTAPLRQAVKTRPAVPVPVASPDTIVLT